MKEKYILLAEDNPNDVILARRALNKCQINNRLVVVSDGREAIDYLFSEGLSEKPAIVLLDLKLPYVDGIDVLRQIREDKNMKDLPVIILTASIAEKDRKESLRLGATGFHYKPIRFDEFQQLMKQICSDWLSD
jgi:two-component system, response regulator